MSKVGAVRSLTRQVARKRRSDRPGFVHAEQLYTDAALVLDASTRVAAATGSGLIDLHLHCVVDHMQTRWVGLQVERNSAHDLVCITSICHAEQLYIDTAFMLAASTRVEAAARSDAMSIRSSGGELCNSRGQYHCSEPDLPFLDYRS
jgi:hypothetical protein